MENSEYIITVIINATIIIIIVITVVNIIAIILLVTVIFTTVIIIIIIIIIVINTILIINCLLFFFLLLYYHYYYCKYFLFFFLWPIFFLKEITKSTHILLKKTQWKYSSTGFLCYPCYPSFCLVIYLCIQCWKYISSIVIEGIRTLSFIFFSQIFIKKKKHKSNF